MREVSSARFRLEVGARKKRVWLKKQNGCSSKYEGSTTVVLTFQ
jgi:hypothetical protein